MDKIVTVGVVGCGYWGPNLVRNFRSLPGCRMQVICDRDRKRLQHLQSLYPDITVETSFEAMLAMDGLDAVVVATPVSLHHRQAMAALEAGKHVFIEKPMATSAADCDAMVNLAQAKGLTLMVGHTFLYSPPVRMIKEIVRSGDIGDLRYISSRRLNLGLFQKDINVVWDLAPHDISIISYIMGETPEAVNCQGKANVTKGIEDVANTSLFFPKGGFATVHSSWLDPRKVRDMTIVGTRKMIVYDDLEPLQKIKIFDMSVKVPPHYDTFAEFQYAYHYGDMLAPRLTQEEPLKVECGHFLECIRTGAEPLSSGRGGRSLVRVLEAAAASLKQDGARVLVERDNPKAGAKRG